MSVGGKGAMITGLELPVPPSASRGSWRNPRLAGRVPELDGIRGLAILLVLIWHYVAIGLPFETNSWQTYLLRPLRLTWSGVDLFFVLSGFLIGGILVEAKRSPNYYQTFYLRRAYRILPIYFLWFGVFLVGLSCARPDRGHAFQAIFNRDLPVWVYPVFLQNFAATHAQTFGPIWMGVTWSLAVEEQFYLLLPFFVQKLNTRGTVVLCLASIVLAPVVRLALTRSGDAFLGPYTLLPCRADALGLGVLVALACRDQRAWIWLSARRRHIKAAFLVMTCGVVFLLFNQRQLFSFGLTWIAGFYTLLLVLVVVEPGPIAKAVFKSQLLVRLGAIAYAVYLFHQGINAILHWALFGDTETAGWSSLSVTGLSLIAVLLLATLSWRLMEKPLIRHAHRSFRYFPAKVG